MLLILVQSKRVLVHYGSCWAPPEPIWVGGVGWRRHLPADPDPGQANQMSEFYTVVESGLSGRLVVEFFTARYDPVRV
eukprot:6800156-Pyramimonas_sp.AAC.1